MIEVKFKFKYGIGDNLVCSFENLLANNDFLLELDLVISSKTVAECLVKDVRFTVFFKKDGTTEQFKSYKCNLSLRGENYDVVVMEKDVNYFIPAKEQVKGSIADRPYIINLDNWTLYKRDFLMTRYPAKGNVLYLLPRLVLFNAKCISCYLSRSGNTIDCHYEYTYTDEETFLEVKEILKIAVGS